MDYSGRTWLSGTAQATNASPDADVIIAQGAGKVIRVIAGNVTITTAAVGGGGLVALEDGVNGTVIWQGDANTVGLSYQINFGDLGFPLTANTKLNLTVNGAATTQATARVAITAFS